MAFVPLNDTLPIDTYTATAGQTIFPYTWLAFEEADIKVFVNDVLKTLTTDYTISAVNQENGANVVFNSGLTLNDAVTITRDVKAERLTGYTTSGNFAADTLNVEQNKELAVSQQLERDVQRSLRLSESSQTPSGNLILPEPSDGKAIIWSAAEDGTVENSVNKVDEVVTNAQASAAAAAVSETNAATSETNAANSASAAATSETNAATSETNAAQSAADAAASVGGVKVSADDTTPDDLETKLLAGDGLVASTQNPGGNETRTLDVDLDTDPGLEINATKLRVKAGDGIILNASGTNVDLEANGGLEINATKLRANPNAATDAVITASDRIIFSDVDDSNNPKSDTVQGVLDLVPTTPSDSVAKAWVVFNGTGTLSVIDSFNVTSVTDNGTGDYTVNFTTAFANANYAMAAFVDIAAGTSNNGATAQQGSSKTTSAFDLETRTVSAGALIDCAVISIVFYGDQ